MTFTRHLSDGFVAALNRLHSESGWWTNLVADRDIFIAIRNEAVNAYYQGCSIAEITFQHNEVRARTHYKYLLRPASSSPYVEAVGGAFQYPDAWKQGLDSVFIGNLSETSALKRAAKPYAGGEKAFVGDILRGNHNALDVEVALTSKAEVDGDRDSAQRIDIAALRERADGLDLVMYEAKLFTNPEVRSRGAVVPVLGQMERYEQLLDDYNDQIRSSYINTARNIVALDGLLDERKAWAKRVLENEDRFQVLRQPILIVGGFDKDQRDGNAWKPHRNKLKDILGDRLMDVGAAKSVNLKGAPLGPSA